MGQKQKYYPNSGDWRLPGEKQPYDSARRHRLSTAKRERPLVNVELNAQRFQRLSIKQNHPFTVQERRAIFSVASRINQDATGFVLVNNSVRDRIFGVVVGMRVIKLIAKIAANARLENGEFVWC